MNLDTLLLIATIHRQALNLYNGVYLRPAAAESLMRENIERLEALTRPT
ncbi:MAG: hypothetical protein M3Q39_15930 [Actinomycetota bacterium]|nr:hypothetical protein [Actinomycetota bacterium]